MGELLLSFFGDDFTGSTDATESLALAGVKTVLFTAPPTPQQLAKIDGLRAFGVAGTTRSMPPDEMERTLRPAFAALRQTRSPTVHYKVCSTFDSSPSIGSIGRVIDVGAEVFESKCVPILVGAPSLGRYCVFGNLFARSGAESEPFRLDRHPSMSRHPVTPMNESDLRVHLSRQTARAIGLLDVLQLEEPIESAAGAFDQIASKHQAVLIDLLYERQLATAGGLIARGASPDRPGFVVGSSGVESALCAHWRAAGLIGPAQRFGGVGSRGPIVAVCGSCSPVTARQIEWARANGFGEVAIDFRGVNIDRAFDDASSIIRAGRSAVIHSAAQQAHIDDREAARIGPSLANILRRILEQTRVQRVLVAGGDTSGQIAAALGIESMEMVGLLTRGSPLVRVAAPGSPADGIEMTFKGGQIGAVDFFGLVRDGK